MFLLNPHPAIEWAFRWLDRQIEQLETPERAPCVVHGDFRIGNMLYDEEGLTALLDWEGTHIGEPEEDIAWLCTRVWRFGKNDLEAGGIASREDWIGAYEKASGCGQPRARGDVGGAPEHPLGRDHDDAGAGAPRRTYEEPRAGGDRPPHGGDGAGDTAAHRCARKGRRCRIGRRPRSCSTPSAGFMRNRAENARDRWERFQFQVAANSIAIIKREIEMEDGFMRAEWEGLDRLLGAEDPPRGRRRCATRLNERNAELSERIKRGEFDGEAEEQLLPHLWETVVNKVRVASPNEIP